ncbi:peptidase M26 [Bacteroides heparinolyticus]|uniref:peptidase M26 n=1 Tax=Prevotella heparinolytica TaxID=28113 RepID=UPI003FA00ACD
MKHSFTIQRLCLFLLVFLLAAPAAWATDYDRYGYETFRSRETVETLGKNKRVLTLEQGHVKIRFGFCKTTSGTGSGAIYELVRGSNINIEADDGYSIRWIILRDTEGGEDYDHPKGKYRISSVTSGYQYYFERNAISNSHISGGNQNQLNDDDNNIVVYQYDASAQSVEIRTHNNSSWDQFKVRDIIVGYVRVPNVRFGKERYDVYYKRLPNFKPDCNFDGHDGEVWYKVDNNDIATADNGGELTFKRPGTVALTATCNANYHCAKVECSTTVNMMRDRVTFTAVGLPDVLFSNTPHNLRDYLYNSKTKSGENFDYNDESFSVTSSNPAVLRYDKPYLKFGGTAGEVTITFTQKETNFYEAASLSHTIIVARRDQYGTILIKDANEWKLFCKLVNEKGMTNLNARLEADVDLGGDIAMVGEGNSYRGTFDGQGHTLKFNWNVGSKSWMAPIKSVTDATIKNLHTEGQITSSTYALSGLVCSVYGTTAISGCVSNVNLTSSYSGSTCDAAGMAVNIHKDARITFDDCVVMGTFNGTESGRAGMSGFVGTFQKGTCILNNCLYLGESSAKSNSSSYTFAPGNATINNCYYLNTCGEAQGTPVTEKQLKSGEVAYLLQNKRPENIWGQLLGTENEPQLTADDAKKVCKVDFTYKGQLKATRYATKGKAIFGDMPTVTPQFLLGSDYNFHHYYRYGFSEYFTASTPVNADRTVGLFIEDRDYYEIASKDDWRRFCDLVRDGQNGIDAKMTADIILDSEVTTMTGNSNNRYAGTFDGQGHTLTLNWDTGSKPWVAPFNTVEGATIKNLRTAGYINSSSHFLSGLVQSAYGNTTISGCVSAVNITSTYGNAPCDAAGMVECVRDNANVTITDCLVKGKFHATTEGGRRYMSGFVNNQYGKCTLINSLYLGENNATGGNTFASTSASGTTLTNCYYLNACGKPQGEQATEKQLKSGYVTNKLQADRTDQCHWAQTLGERPDLYNPANKGEMNYVYHDGTKWACGDFYFKDDNPLPIGLDFTAAYVIYQRSFSFAGMSGTICLPYELPVQRFRAYTLSGGQGNKLYFKEVTGTLEAYKPYYITGLGVDPTPSGTNLQVKAFHDDNLTTATTTGHSMTGTVEGVDNATAAAANAYILQNDGDFHKVTTEYPNAMVPAYHTYIICPKASAGAKQLSIVFEGETTGIDGVTKDASGTDGPVYDLQGRRVADRLDDARHRLPAGVYIVGGRKVILK